MPSRFLHLIDFHDFRRAFQQYGIDRVVLAAEGDPQRATTVVSRQAAVSELTPMPHGHSHRTGAGAAG